MSLLRVSIVFDGVSVCAYSLDDPASALTVVDSKKLDEAALVARTGVCAWHQTHSI